MWSKIKGIVGIVLVGSIVLGITIIGSLLGMLGGTLAFLVAMGAVIYCVWNEKTDET